MHIKLDKGNMIVFGKFLIKADRDLTLINDLTSYQLEGSGVTRQFICCYNDTEVEEVTSILQENEIEIEVVELEWNQEMIDAVAGQPFKSIDEAYSKLLIIKTADVAETNMNEPIAVIVPPETMGANLYVNFVATDGRAFSQVVEQVVNGTEVDFDYMFTEGGSYNIEASCNTCITKKSINVDIATVLTGLKQKRIKELDGICNQAVLAGFKSWCLGTEYTYDFDYEAQINFSGTLNAIAANMVTGSVIWKTREAGPLPHTANQFKKLFMDGMIFKQQTIGKYWQLKQAVAAAKTQEEINSIQW